MVRTIPGVGRQNLAHLFSEIIDEWEAEIRENEKVWDQIVEKLARRSSALTGCADALALSGRLRQASSGHRCRGSSQVNEEAEVNRVLNNDDSDAPPEPRAIALLQGRLAQNLDEIEEALIEQRAGA